MREEEGQAEGWAEGLAEGRAQMLLAVPASRFGPLTEAKRIFTAQTLEEALSQLF